MIQWFRRSVSANIGRWTTHWGFRMDCCYVSGATRITMSALEGYVKVSWHKMRARTSAVEITTGEREIADRI